MLIPKQRRSNSAKKEATQIFIISSNSLILSMEFHLLMPEDLNEEYRDLQSECACEYQDPRKVKEMFISLARVLKNEICMREAEELLRTKENADRLQSLMSELEAYYTSGEWKLDFESDKAGLLPKKLPRGVLSEDGIYNLLDSYRERGK